MGSRARKKSIESQWLNETDWVPVNLREVPIELSPSERELLSEGRTIDPCVHLCQRLILSAVRAKFGTSMRRADGKLWIDWMVGLARGPQIEVRRGALKWMIALLADEKLGLPCELANARESFLSYLEALLKNPPETAAAECHADA